MFHKKVFYVNYHTKQNIDSIDLEYIEIIENIFLFETEAGGFDGFRHNDYRKKTAIIEVSKWGRIALDRISEDNLQFLIGKGVYLVKSSLIYDDKIDAMIQMAFVAFKFGVIQKDVYEITGGVLNSKQYAELSKYFVEEFPEKVI